MEKMEKPLSNSPFMPFYAMNFDHRMTYVAAYLGTLTCLFMVIVKFALPKFDCQNWYNLTG